MKYIITLLSLFPALCMGQNPLYGGNSFVLMGHVDNSKGGVLKFGLSTYLNYGTDSIAIDQHGDFFAKIPMEGETQDFSPRFRDTDLNIYVQNGDTLEMYWNDLSMATSIRLKNTDSSHDRALQALLRLDQRYRHEFLDLNHSIYGKGMSDSAKFVKIDDLYRREMETLSTQHLDSFAFRKIGADIYYGCTSALLFNSMLPDFSLKAQGRSYTVLSEADFHCSDEYRNFLFNYLRVGKKLLDDHDLEGTPAEKKAKTIPFSAALNDYYLGLANLTIYEMRDWFVTKSIMMDFEFYSFDDASKVYEDFMTKVKVGDYADTLRSFYASEQRLKPGASAPAFTLTDDNGKAVSLAEFRGNVVVIDFWGVGCGPCMADIRNTLPAIHEKYKDKKVVFLNICVDSRLDAWKKCLTTVHVGGVNLLATGWASNPVCQVYGVNGIPHYFLIGADGNIVANNGFVSHMTAQIDAALAKIN